MTGRRRRRGRGAGTDVPGRAPDYRNLRTPFSPQPVFSDDEIAALHANALRILAELGIRNLLLEARAVFRAAGLRGARWIGGDRCLVGSRRTGPGATRRPRRDDASRHSPRTSICGPAHRPSGYRSISRRRWGRGSWRGISECRGGPPRAAPRRSARCSPAGISLARRTRWSAFIPRSISRSRPICRISALGRKTAR